MLGQENEVILMARTAVMYHKKLINKPYLDTLSDEQKEKLYIKFRISMDNLQEAVDELENLSN